MANLSTHTVLHKRMSCFVDWIAPDPNKREEIKKIADEVRKNIREKAEGEGITIVDMPRAGSFAEKTGLRRHYRGHSEVDGQDVDIPVVVKPVDEDGDKLEELLRRFEKIVRAAYPHATIEPTKSSIKLYINEELSFDIVPMLATEKADEQIIIRKTGERVKTSIKKHVDFIKSRTAKSNEMEGRVKFNECVRLMKWWREFKAADAYNLSEDDKPSSFLIKLLCAKAFDELGVEKTYADTFMRWNGFLADLVRNQKDVVFMDYTPNPKKDASAAWTVLDPVNAENNIVKTWSSLKIQEFAEWFEEARDTWPRIVRNDIDKEDARSLDDLVSLFGNPFKNHCQNDK